MTSGVLGGLGTFLRQFAAIRDEQAQRALQQKRQDEIRAEEQRRYETEQKQREQDRMLQLAMSMRQFGGEVDPAFASKIREAGAGHILEETSAALPSRPITNAGMGQMSAPQPTVRFRQTPDEIAVAQERERALATRSQLEQLIASTNDPVLKQRLQLALGGINISTDELTPTSLKDARAKDLARFEHGLRMREIGAQQTGRETPEERFLREIDRSELIALSDIAQRTDWTNPADRDAAAAMVRQRADQLRARIQGGNAAPAVDQDLEDIRADFELLKSKTPGANARAILSRMGKDAAMKIQDPAMLQKYQRDLLRFALTLPEVTNNAQPNR